MLQIQHYGGRNNPHYTFRLQLLHFHERKIFRNHKDDNLSEENNMNFISLKVHLPCDGKILDGLPKNKNDEENCVGCQVTLSGVQCGMSICANSKKKEKRTCHI